MIAYYLPLKLLHLSAVALSIGLFITRGLLLQHGKTWAMSAPVRYLSYLIDSILLAAGLLLVLMLPAAVFANGWLAVKLLALLVYIVLGSFALKRGRTAKIRQRCFWAALVVVAFLFSVARSHQPAGWWHWLAQ